MSGLRVHFITVTLHFLKKIMYSVELILQCLEFLNLGIQISHWSKNSLVCWIHNSIRIFTKSRHCIL